MMTTRKLANNLADELATRMWVPEGVNAPQVYMDAITENVDIGDFPIVIVSPRNTTGLYRNNPEHHIDIVLALNASAFHSNAAAPGRTDHGVLIYGSGELLDALVNRLVNTIKTSLPGANLTDLQMEYSLDTLPIQYVTVSTTFKETVAYGDGFN